MDLGLKKNKKKTELKRAVSLCENSSKKYFDWD